MEHNNVVFTIFLIFAGAAVFSTVAIYMRQSLLVAYMVLGVLFGPWGFKTIANVDLIDKVDDIGIIFLLFLLGLHLHPQNLLRMLGKTAGITIVSSLIFLVIGFAVGYWCGYGLMESFVIGACMMFSSTIVSLKLLPLNVIQHQHTGEVMVSILLLQDFVAIGILLLINAIGTGKVHFQQIALIVGALPAILLFVFIVERFVLTRIFAKFAEVREYMFLIAIAWCLGVSELAYFLGLSYEIGAFVAGIAIAASPIAVYIAEQLKPIRDFFLVLFFFSIGASFDLRFIGVIIVPALVVTAVFLLVKPVVFRFLLRSYSEKPQIAWEIGIRLGQLSEFALLIVYLAHETELISDSVVYLIQAVTMLMFIVSSYFVVIRYPTSSTTVERVTVSELHDD